ncbi:hypothetical protein QT971_25060 [Microcoleus sp. herbarium19]|uniref:hypothetical protein n=1 Tax=unclassified Microcoleus TaxID=2642155 RepID=UPI002FD68156
MRHQRVKEYAIEKITPVSRSLRGGTPSPGMSIVLVNQDPRQNFGKNTPAKCPGTLFCSANCSSRETRGIFWVSKATSIQLTYESINRRPGRSNLPQYEVLIAAFPVPDKLV